MVLDQGYSRTVSFYRDPKIKVRRLSPGNIFFKCFSKTPLKKGYKKWERHTENTQYIIENHFQMKIKTLQYINKTRNSVCSRLFKFNKNRINLANFKSKSTRIKFCRHIFQLYETEWYN